MQSEAASKVDNPFPEFAVPEGHTIDSYFEQVCREGLRSGWRRRCDSLEARGARRAPIHEYEARLDYEIGIIKQMKYSGYFLIVWDFIKYARDNGIPVGPGRGSGAGFAGGLFDGDHQHRPAAERAAV